MAIHSWTCTTCPAVVNKILKACLAYLSNMEDNDAQATTKRIPRFSHTDNIRKMIIQKKIVLISTLS